VLAVGGNSKRFQLFIFLTLFIPFDITDMYIPSIIWTILYIIVGLWLSMRYDNLTLLVSVPGDNLKIIETVSKNSNTLNMKMIVRFFKS
jgi:hypothetical protein